MRMRVNNECCENVIHWCFDNDHITTNTLSTKHLRRLLKWKKLAPDIRNQILFVMSKFINKCTEVVKLRLY